MKNTGDELLFLVKASCNTFGEQIGSFPDRRQWCFQLMRNMTKKLYFLIFQFEQALSQPIQTLTDLHKVLWSIDLNGL